jgi:C-terminal processing protease CtpA/Prc
MRNFIFVLTIVFAACAANAGRADIAPAYAPFAIGATLEEAEPWPKVRGISPGSPAAQAGVAVGDQVIAIDGVYAKSVPFYYFARQMEGPEGSTVQIIVLRNENQVLVLSIARAEDTSSLGN